MNARPETALSAERRPQRINLPQGAYFHRAGLRARIAAAHAGGLPVQAARRDSLAHFRDAFDQGRALVRQTFERDGGGLACAGRLAHIEDELIREVFRYVATYIHPAGSAPAGEACAIAAVGGYGRASLAPGSDTDLLFILPAAGRARGERVVEAILYMLWDLGQKVGHATRTIDECLVDARDDMTVRTALLESRLILGNRALFDSMQTRFEREIVRGTAAEFVAAKLAERDSRIAQAGRSRYLVEPNVKDGKGGLRDLNTLFWIAKYVYQLRDEAGLIGAGVFSQFEYKLFRRCEDFLWRVRCHLHFLTGRAEERLSFDHQRRIADLLGYSTRGGLESVERFMKHYFLIAKDVGDLTAIVCAALEEKQAKPSARLDRFGPLRRKHAAIATGDFEVENGRVTVTGLEVFARDPVNLIRLFWVADRNGFAIHPDATRHVTLALKRIDAKLRANTEANRLFLEILTSRNEPEIVLRLMNEAGVLGRFIPEFGRIVAFMQFNMYHHYTVDEHLLRAVGNLAELETQRLAADLPLATDILPSIANRRALFLALFLHDVAKGRVEDHSRAGVEVARSLCPRLGLKEAETETVAWLIECHLIMSDTAQRRDLSDRATIAAFASRVQTLERLKMLFVLTVCDIRAVGPGVWNNWKAELLRTLYCETEVVLAGGHSTFNNKQRVAQAREELRRALPHWTTLDFDAYAARLPQAYWLKASLEQKLLHAKLLNMTEVEVPAPITDVRADRDRGVTELTIIAPDHARLLSFVAGACAATGANIVDAQIFTTADGMAVDTISVSRAFSYDEDELRRAGNIVLTIERALSGQISLRDLVAARSQQAVEHHRVFRIPPEVSVDNTLSNRFTVLEVTGLDRPGLLYDLTAILSRLSLNIASAHIATFGEKAADVFYVTDLTGEKITSGHKQDAIRRAILRVFEPPKEAAVTARHRA
ncbi:MAG: [protein-PII] uridylyltransferase [Beijerinckiaceae bacterium]|nr:[protein-PII] uridylyltransferase [Beijerinckiaceae bacterium]